MNEKAQLKAVMAAHRRWRDTERRGIMRRLALLGYRCETWPEARATGLRLIEERRNDERLRSNSSSRNYLGNQPQASIQH